MTDLWTQLKAARESDNEEAIEELQDRRNMEREAELPHPSCCIRAGKHLYFRRDEVRNGGVPVWKCTFFTSWSGEGSSVSLAVTFCPFCGVKLPALRKKTNLPPHLMVEVGNGYCGTCGERVGRTGYCSCSYPESAYECVVVVATEPDWIQVGELDAVGRRGLWVRRGDGYIELCAGREGDDAHVKLTVGEGSLDEAVAADLVEVVEVACAAWGWVNVT